MTVASESAQSAEPSIIPFPTAASDELLTLFRDMTHSLRRLADALSPAPTDKVDSTYVANKLGVTTTWIADMARKAEIPAHCIVTGTGHGKPWKFHRQQIDSWISKR